MKIKHYYLSAFVVIQGFSAIAAGKILMSEKLTLCGIAASLVGYVYYIILKYIDDKNKN